MSKDLNGVKFPGMGMVLSSRIAPLLLSSPLSANAGMAQSETARAVPRSRIAVERCAERAACAGSLEYTRDEANIVLPSLMRPMVYRRLRRRAREFAAGELLLRRKHAVSDFFTDSRVEHTQCVYRTNHVTRS